MNFLIKILLFPFTLIEKKETLFIFTEDDKIKLYLSDDLYWVSKFDKNSKIDVIKKTIKNRAFELKGLVFEVVSMDKDIEKYDKDFLKLIVDSK